MPVRRPAISQQLMVLRRSGLVSYTELGTRNVSQLDPSGLPELRSWLDGFWDTVLDRFAVPATPQRAFEPWLEAGHPAVRGKLRGSA